MSTIRESLVWNTNPASVRADKGPLWYLCALVLMTVFAATGLILLGPRVGLLLVIVPIGLWFVWSFPSVVLALYLYIPFYKGAVESYIPIDLTVLLAVLVFLLGLPMFLDVGRPLPLGVFAMIALLLSLTIVGVFIAPDLDLALSKLLYFSLLVFPQALLAVRVARDNRLISQFVSATIIFSAVVIVSGIVQIASSGVTGRLEPLSNTIGTARSSLFIVLVAPLLLRSHLKILGWLGVAFIPFGLLVALASGSRGPLLMAAVSIAAINILTRHEIVRKCILGLFALIIGFFVVQAPQVQALIPQESLWRIEKLWSAALGTGELDTSSMGRVHLFNVAIDMFASHPLFGMGTASFEFTTRSIPGLSDQTYPHNLLLQFVAEFGMPGLFVVFFVTLLPFLNAVPRIHEPVIQAAIMLALFAFLNALVSNGIYDNRWLWGMLFLLAAIPSRDFNGESVEEAQEVRSEAGGP